VARRGFPGGIPGRAIRAGFSAAMALVLLPLLVAGCSRAPSGATTQPAPRATVLASPTSAAAQPATLTVQEVKALLAESTKPPIFDARPKASYDAGHVPGASSLPLADLDKRSSEVPKDRLAVFYCSGST
jgi:hypothetical protein